MALHSQDIKCLTGCHLTVKSSNKSMYNIIIKLHFQKKFRNLSSSVLKKGYLRKIKLIQIIILNILQKNSLYNLILKTM